MQPQFVCQGVTDPNAPPPGPAAPAEPAPEDIFSSDELPWPEVRPLNVYAFDPSLGKFVGNYMTASVRYEKLDARPGRGEVRGHRLRRHRQDLLQTSEPRRSEIC